MPAVRVFLAFESLGDLPARHRGQVMAAADVVDPGVTAAAASVPPVVAGVMPPLVVPFLVVKALVVLEVVPLTVVPTRTVRAAGASTSATTPLLLLELEEAPVPAAMPAFVEVLVWTAVLPRVQRLVSASAPPVVVPVRHLRLASTATDASAPWYAAAPGHARCPAGPVLSPL